MIGALAQNFPQRKIVIPDSALGISKTVIFASLLFFHGELSDKGLFEKLVPERYFVNGNLFDVLRQ